MLPRVEVLIDAHQDFYHASSVYAGLDTLARQGLIRWRFRRPKPFERELIADQHVCVVCMNVWKPDAPNALRIAIDLEDQSYLFAKAALQWCEGYFKRSYFTPDVTALPAEWARKVEPFGLNYACRTSGSTYRLCRSTLIPLLLRGASGFRLLRNHFAWPKMADFEQSPATPLDPSVIFQTRVWEAHEAAPGESEVINESRVAIIQALRKAFGGRFLGGLIPTRLALERYPREVTKLPTKRSLYTAMSKRNLIAIYTVGVHQSTAFKLAEHLAAGQCLVAEPPRNELPVPLVPGVHYLPFRTPDECVAACQQLFVDGEAAAKMRRANFDYYNAHVAPASRLHRVLSRYLNFAAGGENRAGPGAAPDPTRR